jgi:hypothetical protein
VNNSGAAFSIDPADRGLEDCPIGTAIKRDNGSVLIRCDDTHAWTNVHIKNIYHAHKPYRNVTHEYLVTFSGGTPSTIKGWHLPFGTLPTYNRAQRDNPGSQIFDKHSKKEDPWSAREQEHNQRIKDKIKSLTISWYTDSTIGEQRQMGHAWLDKFECVTQYLASTTYRVVIIIPYMD